MGIVHPRPLLRHVIEPCHGHQQFHTVGTTGGEGIRVCGTARGGGFPHEHFDAHNNRMYVHAYLFVE